MTTYEIIATVIAGLALAQPWVIKLFVRWFRKIKITFIPSSKLKLYYNKSGSYISIGGVIEAKNQPAVIKNISAKVVRLSDKAELSMDWSSFMVPVFQSVAGNSITTNEIARPFKVEANNLAPVFVEFTSTNTKENNRLAEIHGKLFVEAQKAIITSSSIDEAKSKLRAIVDYSKLREELLDTFFWKESDYCLILSIKYNSEKEDCFKYKFSLDATEVAEFKENVEKIMLCTLDEAYRQPSNLQCVQKDFVSAEDAKQNNHHN